MIVNYLYDLDALVNGLFTCVFFLLCYYKTSIIGGLVVFANNAKFSRGFLEKKGSYTVNQVLSKVKGDAFLSEFFRHTVDLANVIQDVFLDEFNREMDEFSVKSFSEVYLNFVDFNYGHLYFSRDLMIERGTAYDLEKAITSWGDTSHFVRFMDSVNQISYDRLISSKTLRELVSLVSEVEPEEDTPKFWIPFFNGFFPRVYVKGENLVGLPMSCQYHLVDYPIWDYLEAKVNAYF